MPAEWEDLEPMIKACEEAIAHLHALIDEAEARLTLLALQGQLSPPPSAPMTGVESSSGLAQTPIEADRGCPSEHRFGDPAGSCANQDR